jgi:hypothetical protein
LRVPGAAEQRRSRRYGGRGASGVFDDPQTASRDVRFAVQYPSLTIGL